MTNPWAWLVGAVLVIGMLVIGFVVQPQTEQLQETGVERHQVVDDISVYLGVLPIQMAENESDELKLPANVYKKKQRYYVLFALFDAKNGKRIVDADVKASVQTLGGLDFSEKSMEPIHIEKMISYGNYFHMADQDRYKIQASIKPHGKGEPISATFIYHRPKD